MGVNMTPHEPVSRLHYLDWMRLLMIIGVVFAHIDRVFGVTKNPIKVDDHQFDAVSLVNATGNTENSSLEVRWVSILRQICLPMLFWVSGAADACSWKGAAKLKKTLPKLLMFAAIGMGTNGFLWWASPMDPRCSPQSPCTDEGKIWDFNIVYDSGTVFPIVFQMWYIVALVVLILLNIPMKDEIVKAVKKRNEPVIPSQGYVQMVQEREQAKLLPLRILKEAIAEHPQLKVQWCLTVGLCALGIWGAGDTCAYPISTILWVGVTEMMFLSIAVDKTFDTYLNEHSHRVRQYILGFLAVLQWAVSPFSRTAGYLGPGFAVYSFIGFNKTYVMGFVMLCDQIKAQDGGHKSYERLNPLCSRAWPAFPFAYAIVAPSTNWLLAGNLTYPYYEDAIDRVLYCSGAMLVLFTVHRVSQECPDLAAPLPKYAETLGLLLYLVHPSVVTIFVGFGLQNVACLWVLTVVGSLVIVLGVTKLMARGARG